MDTEFEHRSSADIGLGLEQARRDLEKRIASACPDRDRSEVETEALQWYLLLREKVQEGCTIKAHHSDGTIMVLMREGNP